ncbi:hypothetical protein AAG94_21140 [Escherichia albertii]|nr:hypothetical protein [Escherichia albertii]EFO0970786.1 hypothetical protein [Escherichia albertii]EFO4720948.1 hypothetical protein [Escherichia albertii]EFX6074496.1 hypothetical protein [Shigella boydii]KAF0953672.1 hypothetical protein AQU20_15055 [Escherichia albertii]
MALKRLAVLAIISGDVETPPGEAVYYGMDARYNGYGQLLYENTIDKRSPQKCSDQQHSKNGVDECKMFGN